MDLIKTHKQIVNSANHIYLGFSGGLDSCVLLDLIYKNLYDKEKLTLVHINHNLSPNANAWVDFANLSATKYNIESKVLSIKIPKTKLGLEAECRKWRYISFKQLVCDDDLLLTAHHGDDQAETLLLHLLRGTGIKGAKGIVEYDNFASGNILRPILNYSREDILEYAKSNNLKWIEDDSNTNLNISRNLLRLKIFPLLKQRWPKLVKNFADFTKHARTCDLLLTDLARIDLKNILDDSDEIIINKFLTLKPLRQENVLRYYLKHYHNFIPSQKVLTNIINEVCKAKKGAKPKIAIKGLEITRV